MPQIEQALWVLSLLLLSLAINVLLPVSGQLIVGQRNCGIPVNPVGAQIDPARIMGTWYEFMYRTTGISDFNTVNTYTPIARTITPDNNKLGIATNWTVSFYSVQSTSLSCVGIFGQSNFSTNGKKTGNTYFPGATTTTRVTYTTLFTDYINLEVAYRCNTPSTTTNNCVDPWFFINTRVKAPLLNQITKNNILYVVNQTLAPYCLGTQNLSYTGWNLGLPTCNPAPPAGFATLISNAKNG